MIIRMITDLLGSVRLPVRDWTTSTRLSTSRIFDFQISEVSRALVLHAGYRQRGYSVVHGMKWVCVVIM